ncbi:hypothetical protein [Chryseobacterium culicis]|uniref:hypothetical protein n=1 Tax=Chryseobacterium culicis TaxID=680127 RepID=UPI002897277E|nr:hypothetical protein [Chryseobacterium culicis]
MQKRSKFKIFLYVIFTVCFTNKMTAQILEFYKPIIISYKTGLLNSKKVDIGIFDYFKQDTSKMQYEYLKYNSDEESLSKYDNKSKSFQNIICFKSGDFKSQEKIKLGIFHEFNLAKEDDANFIASSPYGKYPSHIQVIKSIKVLQKTKKTLILKIDYQDEFEWKYFGILILTDYRYEKLESDE